MSDGQGESGGHCRVDRIAAVLQDCRPDLGRDAAGRDDHAGLGANRWGPRLYEYDKAEANQDEDQASLAHQSSLARVRAEHVRQPTMQTFIVLLIPLFVVSALR